MNDNPMANDKWVDDSKFTLGKIDFNSFINEQWAKLHKQAMEEMPKSNEMAEIQKGRRKSMTVADLKAMLKNMPDDAEITVDENQIKKVTAEIDLNGNISQVDIVLL